MAFTSLACEQAAPPRRQFAPPPERTRHGHVILHVSGLDFAGAQEFARLRANGHRVGGWAKSCLLSGASDGYDRLHRLDPGRDYTLALLPAKEIEEELTTESIRGYAFRHFGYKAPPAGVVPRIRELVSDKKMAELGFWYIAALHDSIGDADGDPGQLLVERFLDGGWMDVESQHPGHRWGDDGAFAFLV
jgi:hypothetical protein